MKLNNDCSADHSLDKFGPVWLWINFVCQALMTFILYRAMVHDVLTDRSSTVILLILSAGAWLFYSALLSRSRSLSTAIWFGGALAFLGFLAGFGFGVNGYGE